jgi:hypothetical protein
MYSFAWGLYAWKLLSCLAFPPSTSKPLRASSACSSTHFIQTALSFLHKIQIPINFLLSAVYMFPLKVRLQAAAVEWHERASSSLAVTKPAPIIMGLHCSCRNRYHAPYAVCARNMIDCGIG